MRTMLVNHDFLFETLFSNFSKSRISQEEFHTSKLDAGIGVLRGSFIWLWPSFICDDMF